MSVDNDFVRRVEDGIEKREPEHMVPVDMGNKEIDLGVIIISNQFLTKGSDSCAGIDNHGSAALKGNLNACRITPVDCGILARHRDGTPCTPKFYSHNKSSLSATVYQTCHILLKIFQ